MVYEVVENIYLFPRESQSTGEEPRTTSGSNSLSPHLQGTLQLSLASPLSSTFRLSNLEQFANAGRRPTMEPVSWGMGGDRDRARVELRQDDNR